MKPNINYNVVNHIVVVFKLNYGLIYIVIATCSFICKSVIFPIKFCFCNKKVLLCTWMLLLFCINNGFSVNIL